MSGISINRRAANLARKMIDDAEVLAVRIISLPGGAKVIDSAAGGMRAGKLFAEICMGGLGELSFTSLDYSPIWLPGVSVSVDIPAVACMASQYAGWAIKAADFFAMGSGPARALSLVEELYQKLSYRDKSEVAVITLEGRKLPGRELADSIAEKCGVSPENLTILIASTASLVGSVQIAARVVETGMHKMLNMQSGKSYQAGRVNLEVIQGLLE